MQDDFFTSYGGTAPENYERFFVPAIGAPLAVDLLDRIAVRPGERLLDVACGSGIVARTARDRARDGTVAGVDLNGGMIAAARSAAGGSTIEWHEGKAEALPLGDSSFDVVACQLGLQFFADKARSLREMRRVLRDGGRLGVSVVGPTPDVFAIMSDVLERSASPGARAFLAQVFSISESATLKGWLEGADFADVTVTAAAKKLHLGVPAEFLWQYVRATPLAAMCAPLDASARSAIEAEILSRWQPFLEDGRLTCSLPVLIGTARK